ncbi:FtsX-like permease family protein [Streptomyces sp. NPDC048301]|uniref:FtsX-like permease family protein n=1 Tax=Streptomyces sp. NPDC048301 TaxID=3155631 RepID=UPI003449A88B
MWRLSVRSVRHHSPLFLGTFVSLVLGVTLIGLVCSALGATFGIGQPSGRPSVTLPDGEGKDHTVSGGAIDLGGIQTVLVMTGVVCLFVTVFVISGTCALSIALRRRELGLLRLVGAGARQVRRMVIGECLAVAVPAAAVGCLLTVVASPLTLVALNGTGLSPVDLRDPPLAGPLAIASGAGLLMALLGARGASRRASRVHVTEALREAELDNRVMTAGRWTGGLLMLAAGGLMISLTPRSDTEAAIPLALFGTLALTFAASLLGPLYLTPLVRLLASLVRRTRSVPAQLALASVTTARLRTASLTGPILAIIAVVGIFTSVLATTGATVKADDRNRTAGQLIVESKGEDGLTAETLSALGRDQRVAAVSSPARLDVAVADRTSVRLDRGAVVDLPSYARTHRIDVVEGGVTALRSGEIAVSREYAGWYGYHVGSRVTYGLYDQKSATGKVAAVLEAGSDMAQVLLPADTSGAPRPERATLLLEPGPENRADDVARDLTRQLGSDRVTVTPTGQWFATVSNEQERLNTLVLLILAGPASLYALLSVASTLVMSYSRRGREIAGLRLVGLADDQVRRVAVWETLITTGLATLVAAVVVGLGLGVYRASLTARYAMADLSVSWGTLTLLILGCLAVGTAVGLAATGRLLRQGEIAALATRE